MASIWKEIAKKTSDFLERELQSPWERNEEDKMKKKRFIVLLSPDNGKPLLGYWRAVSVQNFFLGVYTKIISHLLRKTTIRFLQLMISHIYFSFWPIINPFQNHFIDPKYLKGQFNAWFMNSQNLNTKFKQVIISWKKKDLISHKIMLLCNVYHSKLMPNFSKLFLATGSVKMSASCFSVETLLLIFSWCIILFVF